MKTPARLLVVAGAILAGGAAHAATLTVTSLADSGAGSLRQVLAGAADGDLIDFSVNGVIVLSSGEVVVSKSVHISGPGASQLTLSGNKTNRVLRIAPAKTVQISGLTITKGLATSSVSEERSGGGIWNDHSVLTISDCVLMENAARDVGGAIFTNGTGGQAVLTVVNCLITRNSVLNGRSGGGIASSGVPNNVLLRVFDSTISRNTANYGGGGIWTEGGTVEIVGSTITGNSGGVLGAGGVQVSANTRIVNCTISGNHGTYGGGIYHNSSTLDVLNSTIANNTGSFGGGIQTVAGTLRLGSSILSNNTSFGPNNLLQEGGAIVTSLGFNLSSDGSGAANGTTDLLNTNPLLGPLQNNGGPTLTHALLPGSPAVDMGKNLASSAADQRGAIRTFNTLVPNPAGGDGTDVGAYEARRATSTTLTSDRDPAHVGDAITFVATVTSSGGGAPAGFVQLQANGIDLGPPVATVGGVATAAVSWLQIGTHTITAIYLGGATHERSSSAPVTQWVNPPANGPNDAAFVSQSVPTIVAPGGSYPASVTLRNNGTSTWTFADRYKLGSQNPADNTTWGFNRVRLPAAVSVPPGSSHTFHFTITAPAAVGTYPFQWRMLREGAGWFGPKTPGVFVNVGNPVHEARFVEQWLQASIPPGGTAQATITMENTGTTTWRFGDRIKLASQYPIDNTTWGLNRVRLGYNDVVPPGATYTFTFDVIAPATPGFYPFQWRMIQEGTGRFGEPTEAVGVWVQ